MNTNFLLVLIQAKKGDTMNFCKKCNCHLDSINTDSKDSRYCISCANAQREFLKSKRNLLQILYNLPLKIKIETSKRIIQEAVNEFELDHVYISYSGGKDSTVLSHIAKELPISDKCCEILKKPYSKKAKELEMKCSILEILASESRQREQDWLKYGRNAFYKKQKIDVVLLLFGLKNIYEYIQKYNVKISHREYESFSVK